MPATDGCFEDLSLILGPLLFVVSDAWRGEWSCARSGMLGRVLLGGPVRLRELKMQYVLVNNTCSLLKCKPQIEIIENLSFVCTRKNISK